jgi:photosystem II stability/assembly factor-like uncharacterized protein
MKSKITLLLLICWSFIANAQWTSQDDAMPGTKTLIDLYAASNQIVWGAGVKQPYATTNWSNDFIKTIDGGNTWTAGVIASAAGYSMSNIFAFDANTAWVTMYNPSAAGGRVYKTTDGGLSWSQQLITHFNSGTSFPNFIYFKDAMHGFVMGDPVSNHFEMYTTSDGGGTWTAVPAANSPVAGGSEYGLTANYCAVGSSIWFGTTTGRVLRSIDFGQHWTATNTGGNYISSVSFKNNLSGLALDSLQNIYSTIDGGNTWNPVGASGDCYSYCIRYVPGTAGTYIGCGRDALGSSNGSAISTDDGATWTNLDLGVYHNAITCYDATNIWTGGYRDSSQIALAPGVYKYSGNPIATIPTITLTYPNGGDTLLTGQSYTITWISNSIVNVMLEYSTDNGVNWNTIIASTPNSNSYSWMVPAIASSPTCKIRVSDVSSTTTNSMSSAGFLITTVNGISSLSANHNYKFYPIPFNQKLTITSKGAIGDWSLHTIDGKKVMEGKSGFTQTVQLNTSELAAGIYIFKTNNQFIKLVKE